MASEIQIRHANMTDTLYAVLQRMDGYTWDRLGGGGQWEEMNAAHWYDPPNNAYNIAMAQGCAYFYVGDWPAAIPERGWYRITIFKRVGGTPNISDTIIITQVLWWNGAALVPAPGGGYECLVTHNPVGEIDEYHLVWLRDGVPVDQDEISSPTITVLAWPQTETTLVPLVSVQACEWDDDDSALRYLASGAERNASGAALVVIVEATIDGAARTWKTVHGRDFG